MADLRPLLIPHHMVRYWFLKVIKPADDPFSLIKGRKRMHLELKETMTRMGSDIKAKVLDSIRATMGAVYSVAGSFTGQPAESTVREEEERRGVEEHSGEEQDNNVVNIDSCLNMGRRIDYVLQVQKNGVFFLFLGSKNIQFSFVFLRRLQWRVSMSTFSHWPVIFVTGILKTLAS